MENYVSFYVNELSMETKDSSFDPEVLTLLY